MTMCVSDHLCVTHVLPHINLLRILHCLVDLTTKQTIVVKSGKRRRRKRRRRRRRRKRRRRRRKIKREIMNGDRLLNMWGREKGKDEGISKSGVVLTIPFQVNGKHIGQSMNCELFLRLSQLLTAADKPA